MGTLTAYLAARKDMANIPAVRKDMGTTYLAARKDMGDNIPAVRKEMGATYLAVRKDIRSVLTVQMPA